MCIRDSCNDYGMKQVALEGVTGDSDPSPSQMAKVVDQIKSEGISCISVSYTHLDVYKRQI